MIITDDFVMLNFPKTGSSFAREALKRLYANRNIIELMLPKITEKRYRDRVDQHGTFRQIPLAHKNKPVLSITRNPLSRFQSTYQYRWWEKNPPTDMSKILKIYPHFPNLSFKEYYEMSHTFSRKNFLDDINLKIELGVHSIQFIHFYFNNPEEILRKIDYEYIENGYFLNDMENINFIHQENLVKELKEFLVNFNFSQNDLSFFDSMKKINVTENEQHKNYESSLITHEIEKQIIQREKLLFTLFPEYIPSKVSEGKSNPQKFRIDVNSKSINKKKSNKLPKITLSMIVKNEEKYLRGCLESVKDIVDEIVLVDTGSTDTTLDIANEYGAKIYHFEWIKDFSAARNFALSKSTGDWILYLDADERIEKKSQKELFRLTKNNKKLGINCIINNLDDNKNAPTLMKYVRIFKNGKNISFVGKAHEQIEASLLQQGYKIIDSTIEITHLGYNVSKDKLKEKAARNLELLLNEYNEKPTSYGAYQIANSYSVLDNMEQSIYYTKKTLEYKNLRKEFKSVCYLRIADFEMQKGNLVYAKELIDKGIQGDRNHPLMNFLASHIYKKFNKSIEALNFCKNALKQNLLLTKKNKSKNVVDIAIDSKKIIYYGLILAIESGNIEELDYFLEKLNNYNQNESLLFKMILQNRILIKDELNEVLNLLNESNLELLLKLMEINNNNSIKLEFYSSIYDRFNKDPKYATSFGSFLINIGQLKEAEVILRTSLQNEEVNPAVIFYLISIYVQQGELDKIKEIILIGEQLVSNNQTLKLKLNDIKNKLAPMLEPSLK